MPRPVVGFNSRGPATNLQGLFLYSQYIDIRCKISQPYNTRGLGQEAGSGKHSLLSVIHNICENPMSCIKTAKLHAYSIL